MPRTYVTSSRVETRREGYLAAGRLAPEGGPSRMTGRLGGTRARACVLAAALVTSCAAAAPAHAQRPEPTPEPNFAVNVLPRPCAYEGNDKYERQLYKYEGWNAPHRERPPGALPADALPLRADPREAGPERRADRAGDDREADAGRLRDALQSEPRDARRHRAAGREGAPAPRHLAVGAVLRQRPVLRRRRGED